MGTGVPLSKSLIKAAYDDYDDDDEYTTLHDDEYTRYSF
jgi:hypothetical protein